MQTQKIAFKVRTLPEGPIIHVAMKSKADCLGMQHSSRHGTVPSYTKMTLRKTFLQYYYNSLLNQIKSPVEVAVEGH